MYNPQQPHEVTRSSLPPLLQPPPTLAPSGGDGIVGGMKQVLLMIAVVTLVGCVVRLDGSMGFDPIVEKAIRKEINKPKGELTEADLEKVTDLFLSGHPYGNKLTEVPKGLEKLTQLKELDLNDNQLTNVKGLEKLTQLEDLYLNGNKLTDVKGLENLTKLKVLYLGNNPALTKAQIDELKKALPKCEIDSNPTK